ncbi:large subunit ribosomal protein L31e [Pancytospora epiphaga]|nr:large subunit ribosomal protein L31e [Pancytospora epiphaga]
MSDLAGSKVTEITVNTRKLICKTGSVKSTRKAAGAVKMLKRFIQKQWSTKDAVHLSDDLNKHIWARGNKGCVGRVRIRVERGACLVNPENKVIRLSLVEVSSFKGLNDCPVDE